MTTSWKRTALVLGAVLIGSFAGCTVAPPAANTGTTTTAGTTVTTAVSTTTITATTTEPVTTTTTRPVDPADMGKVTSGDFDFSLGGVDFHLLDDADPVLAALGEPVGVEKPTMFGGLRVDEMTYYDYGTFVVSTVICDGQHSIAAVTVKDPAVILYKGVAVGCTKEDILAAYGEATYAYESHLSYEFPSGDTLYSLSFSFDSTDANGEYQIADTPQSIHFDSDYFHWKE